MEQNEFKLVDAGVDDSIPQAPSPEEAARLFLEKIEHERFETMDDPGIHGIKLRLERLPFIKSVGAECCSGHPKSEELTDADSGAKSNIVRVTPGYLCVDLTVGDPRSVQFYDLLRDRKLFYSSYDFREEAMSLHDKENGTVSVRIQPPPYILTAPGTPHNIQKAADIITEFWQRLSALINEFESVPIKEDLKSHYFGFKSAYGKIGVTDPYFNQFKSEDFGKRFLTGDQLKGIMSWRIHDPRFKASFIALAKKAVEDWQSGPNKDDDETILEIPCPNVNGDDSLFRPLIIGVETIRMTARDLAAIYQAVLEKR